MAEILLPWRLLELQTKSDQVVLKPTPLRQTAPHGRLQSPVGCEQLAKLMTRFGKRVAVFAALRIEYPVGRAGARFEGLLPTAALRQHDLSQLRFFFVQDDAGNRYPAMIENSSVSAEDEAFTAISGVVVAGW